LCSPKLPRRWRAGKRGDTSPLRGLAYANAAFAYANVFASNWLQRKQRRPAAAPFANANVLILWGWADFCAIFEIGVVSQVSPPAGEEAEQDLTRRSSAERLPLEAGRSHVGPDLKENGASHVGFMDATQKKGSPKQLRGRSLGTKLSELVHETRPGNISQSNWVAPVSNES
jgi:hypothetical protein